MTGNTRDPSDNGEIQSDASSKEQPARASEPTVGWFDGVQSGPTLQRRTLTEQATDLLREAIVTGRLLPGQHLTQVQLAAQLGISRTPLREALRTLENEGLLRQVDAQGLEVVQLGPGDLLDLNGLRELVDGLSARIVAERLGNRAPAEFRDLLARMAQTAAERDLLSWQSLDIQFHELIVRLAGNRYVLRLLSTIRLSSLSYQRVLWKAPNHPVAALDEHRRIVEAIESGDPDRAEDAARQHVRSRQATFLQCISEETTAAAHRKLQ